MNKKYFAKYLSVEEERKIGDYVRHKVSGDIGIITKISDESKYQDEEIEKVKLFLCSKDIQEGDEVQDQDGYKYLIDNKRIKLLNSSEGHLHGKVFKLIAEISPNAVWVEEGDEFYEKELEFVLLNKKFPSENIYFENIMHNTEWCKLNPIPILYRPIIKIQCSQCKNFH